MLGPGGSACPPPPAWHPLPTVRGAAASPLPPTGARALPMASLASAPHSLTPSPCPLPQLGARRPRSFYLPKQQGPQSCIQLRPPPATVSRVGIQRSWEGLCRVLREDGPGPAVVGGQGSNWGSPSGGARGRGEPGPPHPCFTPMSPHHVAHSPHACTVTHTHTLMMCMPNHTHPQDTRAHSHS